MVIEGPYQYVKIKMQIGLLHFHFNFYSNDMIYAIMKLHLHFQVYIIIS